MMLSIVTVVFNDLDGLKKTIESVFSLLNNDVEYWVIDGSNNKKISQYLTELASKKIKWISEPDNGIYDAMNKGIARAEGDYLIFMNAGDIFHKNFSISDALSNAATQGLVVLGRSIEGFGDDRYLRPGVGHESNVFGSPSHQATFYPRSFYSMNLYRLDKPINADGNFTARAIKNSGAVFVPMVVSEFSLGGISSCYGLKSIKYRLKETKSVSSGIKLFSKVLAWYLLPQKYFYRLLASWKYTRLKGNQMPMENSQKIFKPNRAACKSQ